MEVVSSKNHKPAMFYGDKDMKHPQKPRIKTNNVWSVFFQANQSVEFKH